jgi:hypothetical protein
VPVFPLPAEQERMEHRGECIGMMVLMGIGILLILLGEGGERTRGDTAGSAMQRYRELDGLDGEFDGKINPDEWSFSGGGEGWWYFQHGTRDKGWTGRGGYLHAELGPPHWEG